MGEEEKQKKNLIHILQPFLAFLGIFAALCYLLGRWQLEAYYNALGITPNVLSFTVYDYMFSSLEMVIMCLVISCSYLICWRWMKPRTEWNEKKHFVIFIIFGAITMLCEIYAVLLMTYNNLYIPIISGLIIGLFFGIFPITIFVNPTYLKLSVAKNPKLKTFGNIMKIMVAIFTITIIFLLPMYNQIFADARADINKKRFPNVVVIYKNRGDTQLPNSSSNLTESIEGKLALVNNGIAYLLNSENASNKWQIHAIPIENIKEMSFFFEKGKK